MEGADTIVTGYWASVYAAIEWVRTFIVWLLMAVVAMLVWRGLLPAHGPLAGTLPFAFVMICLAWRSIAQGRARFYGYYAFEQQTTPTFRDVQAFLWTDFFSRTFFWVFPAILMAALADRLTLRYFLDHPHSDHSIFVIWLAQSLMTFFAWWLMTDYAPLYRVVYLARYFSRQRPTEQPSERGARLLTPAEVQRLKRPR